MADSAATVISVFDNCINLVPGMVVRSYFAIFYAAGKQAGRNNQSKQQCQ
jgi:hypothetical protein